MLSVPSTHRPVVTRLICTIGVLPLEAALEADFRARRWSFVAVPGAMEVIGIQPRITTARAVMIQIISADNGKSTVIACDLEMVGVGQIESAPDRPVYFLIMRTQD